MIDIYITVVYDSDLKTYFSRIESDDFSRIKIVTDNNTFSFIYTLETLDLDITRSEQSYAIFEKNHHFSSTYSLANTKYFLRQIADEFSFLTFLNKTPFLMTFFLFWIYRINLEF